MKRILSVFSLILLLCSGCKNEIDLLTDYEAKLVCYSILDPADTVHYVRISRIFSGNGNALEMAQVPDTTEFDPGTLFAKIERLNGEVVVETFPLSPDSVIPRDPGVFPSPHQILYRGVFPVLKDGSKYRLVVDDLSRDLHIESITPIATDPNLFDPAGINTPLNFENPGFIRFRFNTGTNGIRYDCRLRFHYSEQFIFDTTQTTERSVDWYLGELTAADDNGGHTLQLNVERHDFLQMLSIYVDSNPYVRRIAGKIDFVFIGAAEDLVTYIEVEKANQTTSASIPPFTNIDGGLGLFSNRTTSEFRNFSLDLDTRDALRIDPITQSLNFVR
jgi:hypothetical protein